MNSHLQSPFDAYLFRAPEIVNKVLTLPLTELF